MSEIGFLADTHIVLWWLGGDNRLSPPHRKILDGSAPVFFSSVSIAEIAIKVSIGKLRVANGFSQRLLDQNVLELKLSWRHAQQLADLPLHHRDPFDRLLIVQARAAGLTLMTDDTDIQRYDIPTV